MGLNVNKRGFLERIARALEKARDEGLIGDKVSVDSEMSDTSENPVQNKVIKEYVDQNAGGGSNVFVVTFTMNDEETFICDKTYSEITEAANDNKNILGLMSFGSSAIFYSSSFVLMANECVFRFFDVIEVTAALQDPTSGSISFNSNVVYVKNTDEIEVRNHNGTISCTLDNEEE